MKLRIYLSETAQSHAQFAKLVGCHPITVSKWATGRMFPRCDALRTIETLTAGAVTANDFLDRPEPRQPAPAEAHEAAA